MLSYFVIHFLPISYFIPSRHFSSLYYFTDGDSMPRIDDYQQALELGRQELSDKDPDLLAGYAGAEMRMSL